MHKLYTTALLLFMAFFSQAQCLLQQIPLPQRVQSAQIIVEAKVLAKCSFEDVETGRIYTSNKLEILRIFKAESEINSQTINLITFGGQVGDRMETANPSLQVEKGEVGIFMLAENTVFKALKDRDFKESSVEGHFGVSGPSSYIAYDIISQKAVDAFETFAHFSHAVSDLEELIGHASTTLGSFNFPTTATNKKAAISSFSPTTVSAGNGTVLTINGSGFGADYGSVAFANADNGGSTFSVYSDSVHIISWSDTKIEVIVPQAAGTGKIQVISANNVSNTSADNLTVTYARLAIVSKGPSTNPGQRLYYPNLEDDNSLGGYTWSIHKDFKKEPKAVKAIMRAMQSWRCSTGLNFDIDTTNATTVDKVDRDGVHCIMWQNPNQSISTGALAVTFSLWSGCFNANTKDWHWFLNDVDMVFDDELSSGRTWNYGPNAATSAQYDMESVALHELGHAHQLGHIIDASGVMHYSIRNGESKRTLSPSVDVAGGNDVMATSSIPTGCSQVNPMVEITTNCKIIDIVDVIAQFSMSSNKACVGDTVTITNTSEPKASNLHWRIPKELTLISGTKSSEEIQLVLVSAGKVSIGLLVENSSFTDSVYMPFESNKTPKPLSKIDQITCFGENNGKASFILGEGTTPFTITWLDNNKAQNPRTDLKPGTYNYICEDATGCTVGGEIIVTQPDSLYFADFGTEPSWGGLARGKAFVSISGGTAPYKVKWNDNAAQKTDTAVGLLAGSYEVTVTDKNACVISKTLSVEELSAIENDMAKYFYPNPSAGQLYFTNIFGFSNMIIRDFSGKILLESSIKEGENSLSIEQLPNATYFVQLLADDKVAHVVVVKI